MDAFAKAPPTKEFSKPSIPPEALCCRFASWLGSIPGRTMKDPSLNTKINASVRTSFFLNSSIVQIFFNVLINFFTELSKFNCCYSKNGKQISINYLTISIVPPAASIAPLAFLLIAFTLKGILAFKTPFPKIFTLSVWLIRLLI